MNVFLQDAGTSLRLSALLYDSFNFFIVFGNLDSHAPVGVLSWLQDPDIVAVSVVGGLVVFGELIEEWVINSILDVESNWQGIKWINTHGLIVVLHVDKESLFVSQMVVVLDLVVKLVWVHLHLLEGFVGYVGDQGLSLFLFSLAGCLLSGLGIVAFLS